MAIEAFIIYIAIAFAVGVVTGWLMIICGSGFKGLTREESRHVYRLLDKIDGRPNTILCLWNNGVLIDSVTIGEDEW